LIRKWIIILIPIVLTFALIFLFFVPIVNSGFKGESCNSSRQECVTSMTYDSVTYAYGDRGGVFVTHMPSPNYVIIRV
jgi:hypothetical protein